MRECFLDELPKYKDGRYKNKIQWQNSNRCKIKFVYDDIQGEFVVLDYNKNNHILKVQYNNSIYELATGQILCCNLGGIVLNKLNDIKYKDFIKNWKLNNKDKKYIRKVFFENLDLSKGLIDWNKAVGKKVYFIYKNLEGYIDIINYTNRRLFIKYKDYDIFEIGTGQFKECKLGNMLKVCTGDFRLEIGQIFKDDKRDLIIIDREYRPTNRNDNQNEKRKWYKYHCNECGAELWIEEHALVGIKKQGCSCCCNHTVVQGINDITTTHPWLALYFKDEEEAKLYTYTGGGNPNNRNGLILAKCPECGRTKDNPIRIYDLYKNHGFKCVCGDGISIPNKVLLLMLEQLKEHKIIDNFETEKTFDWSLNRRYDGYINSSIIIEMNGGQHYRNIFRHKDARNLKEENENDALKRELAFKNDIKEYIEINCDRSELEYIKQNILNSRLAKLFDLSQIDWNYIGENMYNNLVKVACEYKKNNPNLTTFDIANIMGVTYTTIHTYLVRGTKLGWCAYNGQEERNKANLKRIKTNSIPIICINNEKIYKSASFCSRISKQEFGINLIDVGIRYCCYGKQQDTKGYQFKYIKDLTPEEYIKYDIKNKLNELHNQELVQAV